MISIEGMLTVMQSLVQVLKMGVVLYSRSHVFITILSIVATGVVVLTVVATSFDFETLRHDCEQGLEDHA